MINFNTHLISPIQFALNNALGGQTSGAFNYHINDIPKNYRYAFNFNTDTGDYLHAEKVYESGTLHDDFKIYFNGNAQVNPISIEGITQSTYNALVDATIEFSVPLGQIRGATRKAFVGEIRRLVDDTLQSSQTRLEVINGQIYQIGTQYSLLATGTRQNRSSIGDSVNFLLRLTFTVVAMGISSDTVELWVAGNANMTDAERIFYSHFGMARKAVKEMGELSSSVTQNTPIPSQKSFISGTYLSINFDLPARFSAGTANNTSFNEKVAKFVLSNTSDNIYVKIKYPKTVTTSGTQTTVSYEEQTFTMKFDTVGVNGETGLIASQSITLTEV